MTALFIGVVSYPASRFAVSTGPDGLGHTLAARLSQAGIDSTVEVNATNAYEPPMLAIDGRMVARSLHEQLNVERRWAAFLRQGPDPAGRVRGFGARGVRRCREWLRYIRPWHGAERDSAGSRRIRRLINIELSHFSLMRSSVAAGSDWTLIIEDDASCRDLEDCARGLIGLMAQGTRQPAYVNVSQSFNATDLGISHLIAPVPGASWQGSASRAVMASTRPVTNTVCAILYRTCFVRDLLAVADAMPLDPVIPIDWKLNLALMHMFEQGDLTAGDCWTVMPAPIDQLSMVAQG